MERVSPHAVGLAHPVGKHATDAALGVKEQGEEESEVFALLFVDLKIRINLR